MIGVAALRSARFRRCGWAWLLIGGTVVAGQASVARADPSQFSGVWRVIDPPALLHTDASAVPPMRADAAARYARNIANRKVGALDFDSLRRCLLPGIPRLYIQPTPMKILTGSTTVAMFFQWNHAIRLIHLNEPHYEPIGPAYLGQSIGHWDGDTLVVDTTQFNDATLLDDALPHSTALHVVERFRLGAGRMQLDDAITIDDPNTFAAPWRTTLHFRRLAAGTALAEDYCLRRTGLLKSD